MAEYIAIISGIYGEAAVPAARQLGQGGDEDTEDDDHGHQFDQPESGLGAAASRLHCQTTLLREPLVSKQLTN